MSCIVGLNSRPSAACSTEACEEGSVQAGTPPGVHWTAPAAETLLFSILPGFVARKFMPWPVLR